MCPALVKLEEEVNNMQGILAALLLLDSYPKSYANLTVASHALHNCLEVILDKEVAALADLENCLTKQI
nr:hypothetical protein [uncultured Cohaesibacter sp.]